MRRRSCGPCVAKRNLYSKKVLRAFPICTADKRHASPRFTLFGVSVCVEWTCVIVTHFFNCYLRLQLTNVPHRAHRQIGLAATSLYTMQTLTPTPKTPTAQLSAQLCCDGAYLGTWRCTVRWRAPDYHRTDTAICRRPGPSRSWSSVAKCSRCACCIRVPWLATGGRYKVWTKMHKSAWGARVYNRKTRTSWRLLYTMKLDLVCGMFRTQKCVHHFAAYKLKQLSNQLSTLASRCPHTLTRFRTQAQNLC